MTRNVYKYKPLLFTTTMRNPERLKDFLLVLQQYDRQILTGEIITKVVKELISKGLYKPTKASELVKQQWKQGIELSITLTEQVYAANPQSHKEAGFEKGWPSRFDTWFKISKELGLVYYRQNEQISFSETGLMLLDKEKPENEQLVFANAFAKYQRHNPFRKVLNKNIPLILLLQTIQYLNKDKDYNGAGIARKEIPLLLCWQNNNALELYHKIKQLRNQYGFAISDEVMLEQCYALLDEVKRDNESILNDYPDDFIRKMRLTGLISIRGGGRFVDINAKETKAVTYIIENYANYLDYESEEVFFNFISKVDKKLVTALTTYHFSAIANKKELQKWTTFYSWEQLKTELLKLAHNNPSNDAILKLIEKPLRLEFLTTLAILKKYPIFWLSQITSAMMKDYQLVLHRAVIPILNVTKTIAPFWWR